MRFAEEVALEKGRQCRRPVRKSNDGSNQRRDHYGGENGTTGDQLQGGLTERRIERVAAPACGFGVYAGCTQVVQARATNTRAIDRLRTELLSQVAPEGALIPFIGDCPPRGWREETRAQGLFLRGAAQNEPWGVRVAPRQSH
jgi:hypothetical protein